MDCTGYEDEVKKINEKLGGKFKDVLALTGEEVDDLKNRIGDELRGEATIEGIECYIREYHSLGKITPLMEEEDLEEIMVIGQNTPVYVYDRRRGMYPSDIELEEREIEEIIQKIAKFSGRSIASDTPVMDARLPDGSRVNATLPVVTPKGSTLTIRRFKKEPLTISDLLKSGTLNPNLAAFLWVVVEGLGTKPANILIMGGTASGKTTTLNALSYFIPQQDRILSIEDVLEISLRHQHWIPMETRPPDKTGKEITMDDLLKNALRMRPDRLIVGEVRAEEALTLFTAMNTGHDGCMATIHANTARECLNRLQSHPMRVPDIMIPALDLIVAQKRQVEEGKLVRRIFEVVEVSGREADNILTNTLFKYDPAKKELETQFLNGRIVQELSQLANISIKEIDEEIERRAAILDSINKGNLSPLEVHRVIQKYYKDPDEAIDLITQIIKGKSSGDITSQKGSLGI